MNTKLKNETFSPHQNIIDGIINRVILKSWNPNYFHSINNFEEIKCFYNNGYENFEEILKEQLNKYHPASWILEAYIQLQLWSVLFFEGSNDNFITGNEKLAPIGRYGWRYVIDVSVQNLAKTSIKNGARPTQEEKDIVFTALAGMCNTSEISNFFHFIGDRFNLNTLIFSPELFKGFPPLSKEDTSFLDKVKQTLDIAPDWENYEQFSPLNDVLSQKVDDLLLNHFSITLAEIQSIMYWVEQISIKEAMLILVQPLEDFIRQISLYSGLSRSKIESFLNLTCFSTNVLRETRDRDFLRKSQRHRMYYYLGIIINLDSNLESIYDEETLKRSLIHSSNTHIIISPMSFDEWLKIFQTSLILGQREDLKQSSKMKNEIASIESYYRIKVFEVEVLKLLEAKKFVGFNLDKLNGKKIECGEIDIIAYSEDRKELFVIECKALTNVVDYRGLGQLINDHYVQKKYHKKFLRKIKWVNEEIEPIKLLFKSRFNVDIPYSIKIVPYFVTSFNSTIGLIEDKYQILTFEEFDKLL